MQHFTAAIPPEDIALLETVLDAWCCQNNMPRSKAENEARILISEYQRGVRSQIGLVDAPVAEQTHT